MKKTIYPADARGQANYGWLNARYSFSFAQYHNPERIHFGLLRVLNDDIVDPGRGFDMHPHDNMEIVTIPLAGALEHKDNQGHHGVIKAGDVQIMSAGSGIVHSEYNHSKEEPVNLFQIWVFPKERNITPRYEQKTYSLEERKNKWQTVVSPEKSDASLWINQNAYFSLGNFKAGMDFDYKMKMNGNGLYAMVIDGAVEAGGESLGKRDAIGLSEVQSVSFSAKQDAELLLIEVPMH